MQMETEDGVIDFSTPTKPGRSPSSDYRRKSRFGRDESPVLPTSPALAPRP